MQEVRRSRDRARAADRLRNGNEAALILMDLPAHAGHAVFHTYE